MGKFILIADHIGKPQSDALTQFLSRTSLGYWHWVENAWLIQTEMFATAKSLNEYVLAAMPGLNNATMIVLRIDEPKSYWGRAPKEGWDWLNQHGWGEPK